MHHRAEYLIQVLEKIGAPLLAAVITANAKNDGALHNEAQKIAELLAKTVQTSIEMTSAIDLGPTGQMTDSIRVALTGLAGPMVAHSFENSGRTPNDADIKRIMTALQAVLSFAENFEANSENSDRLKDLSAAGQSADTVQAQAQYLQAFVPVIGAVGAFSFGQPEQKLIMDISSRLATKASSVSKTLVGDDRIARAALNALAEIYAACHRAEIQRLEGMSDDQRAQAGLSVDGIWKNFDAQAAMLEALAQGLVTGAATQTQSSGTSSKAPEPSPAPAAQQEAPPVSLPAAPPATPPAGGSPMSFFKTPPKTG